LVEQRANVAFLFLSYFDYVMLTYERYQALRAINIRVPGEPGNEATLPQISQINLTWNPWKLSPLKVSLYMIRM